MDEKKYMKEHNYKVWEVKDIEELNWNNISYDGHGYVLTTDGSRYDSPNDEALYRQERQRWNELKVNNSIEKKSLPMLDPNIKASLRNFFSSTDVLIEQEIIRSSKYSADIAEYLCAKLFGLVLCDNQREVGYDAMNAQGKKIQIKINNSTKKTNQDIGDKSAYDYLYLVVTRNSLMFNADYASAFLLFYVLSSEDIPGDKYIAKNFIKGLTPIIAVDSQFKII